MIRFLQIVALVGIVILLTGCSRNASEKNDTLWQQVKIGDIAPSRSAKQSGSQLLKTINFGVYIFEIPAENISILNDIWPMLYTKPLQFNDYNAFCANSFLAGFGQVQMWNKIADMLRAAGGRKSIETTSLLLFNGQANDLAITRLDNERTVFYISTAGSMEGATIGPGKLALRIRTEKIPGSRGVRNVNIQPVFTPLIKNPIPQLAAREKSGELLFTSAGFELKMSPGDFVLLGPEKYISHQTTLAGLFFSKARRKPAVRIFLLVCTRIND